jgi:hypothetical protein
MNAHRTLPAKFARARLDLELLDQPLGRGRTQTSAIVQIDIAAPPSARFRIFPGARDNRIEVLGPDRSHRQLVLFVDEPRRRFEVWVPKARRLPPDARVVRETATSRAIEHFTPGRKRHFLCGVDEQHLFIAELPWGASSTHAAREALRAPDVPSSLVLRGEKIVRQGEWFFLPTLPRERAEIERSVSRRRVLCNIGIAQAARLPRGGRPHVADEVVLIEGSSATMPRIFVRGEVRHPDHRTVAFRDFRRTVPNRERFAQPEGVFWVD